MGEIIAVINQKGGTGKTTTTINLGTALADLGKRVLLVDFDPQASLSYSLGLSPPRGTLIGVFSDGSLHKTENKNLHVLPSSLELADIELALASTPGREDFLKNYLRGLRGKYDYVLIDCAPSLSVLTVNALNASDGVLIPVLMEVLSLQGLTQLLATMDDFKRAFQRDLRIKGILPVRYNPRWKLSSEVLDLIRTNVQERVFDTVIRENVRVAEAPSFAKSVLKYAPQSAGAKDYRALAQEFLS
ncbi:MAG: ParA family protein [Acidobacteriota bacterium]